VSESRVVFALDLPSLDEARAMAARVRGGVGMLKVGLELFVEAGPCAVAIGEENALPVFLDLKLCDIPETVDRAVARASALGAQVITVHASGGPAMLARAVKRAQAEGGRMRVVAVTVLTSFDANDLERVGVAGDVQTQVLRLARMAWAEGVCAFVCSPREARALRGALPEATIITPGVRDGRSAPPPEQPPLAAPAEEPPLAAPSEQPPQPGRNQGAAQAGRDDQKRVTTAAEAIAAGADWVVVGRPIRDAADPLAAAQAITREVDEARRASGR
jgi:orotidine-5'-phosphate decarboxylase